MLNDYIIMYILHLEITQYCKPTPLHFKKERTLLRKDDAMTLDPSQVGGLRHSDGKADSPSSTT